LSYALCLIRPRNLFGDSPNFQNAINRLRAFLGNWTSCRLTRLRVARGA